MSLIHRVLQRVMGQVARLVCAYPGIILTISVLLAVASSWIVATRFNVVNNTSDLLSDKYEAKRNYDQLTKDFGSDYRYIVLIQSPDPVQNRLAADEIGNYLQTVKPYITTVLSKIDFSSVKPRLLFTRSVEDLEKIAQQLQDQVNLQKQTQEKNKKIEQMALDLNSILSEASEKFNDPTYLHKKENWKDFTPFVKQFDDILNKVSAQAEGKTVAQVTDNESGDDSDTDDVDANEMIAEHEYFSLQGGQTVLVFAYTNSEGEKDSASPFSHTTATIRAKLQELEKKYPGTKIELTGEPALDTDQAEEANADAAKAGMITMALIIGLFFISYRTFLRPTFAILVLIMAVLWSLGFALITVGHFNILSVAVIPMVLGIGIDFGIQILGRYEEELGHGRTINEAVTAALQHTGVAIITGGSTTAAAFFTLCFNDFVGLAELGVIAGASMVFCIVANLVLLPAVFILRDRKLSVEQLKAHSSNTAWHFIQTWDRDMVRNPWLWIIVSIVISIAAAISLPELKFDYNLLHLDNPNAPSVKALYEVMDASKGNDGTQISTIYASVVADNLDEARALSKKLLALPEVAKVESILELVPEDQDKKLPIIKRIVTLGEELNVKPASNKPVDIPRARRDIASLLSQAKEGLKQATAYEGISSVAKQAVAAFASMVPALERADKALNSASVAVIQKRFSASSTGAFSRMQANMELLKTQKADRGLTLADVPPQLQKAFCRAQRKDPAPSLRQEGPLGTRAGRGIHEGGALGRAESDRHPDPELLCDGVAAGELSLGGGLGLCGHRDSDLPPLPELQIPAADPHAVGAGGPLAHRRDGLVRHRIQPGEHRHAAADHRHRCGVRRLHHRPLSRGRQAQHLRRQHGQGDHHVVADVAFRLQLAADFRVQRHVRHRAVDVARHRHRSGHGDLYPPTDSGSVETAGAGG